MKYIPTAWMLRNDGVAIPCIQHIYANVNELDETLYAAEWLYKNTTSEKVRKTVLRLILSYGLMLDGKTPIEALKKDIRNKPYVFITEDFIDSISFSITNYPSGDIPELSKNVEMMLNREFTRTRYGGIYNTLRGNQDLYFRISTDNFEWIDIFRNFIESFDAHIETVTVVRDEESTGDINTFYKTKSGEFINKMPLPEFMNADITTNKG